MLGPKGIYPNVDFYRGIVYEALGIPRDLFTPIFAIARVAGWLAHWLEQLKNNRIYRPEQIYVGKQTCRMCRWRSGRERRTGEGVAGSRPEGSTRGR